MRTITLLVAACCSAGVAAGQDKETIVVPGLLPAGLPFTAAVRVGDLLFLSGQIGIRQGTLELVQGGIEAETRQTMENIKTVLEYAGSSLARVVKCTVFLRDIADWAAMNAVYASYFEEPPARSSLATGGLALGAAVEIECIAVAAAGR